MSDSLELMKKLAGLNEMESDSGQAIMMVSSLKTSMEHLESMVNGGKGNPMQVIAQMVPTTSPDAAIVASFENKL